MVDLAEIKEKILCGVQIMVAEAADLVFEVERLNQDIVEPLRDEMKAIALASGRSQTDGESDCDWHDLSGEVEELRAENTDLKLIAISAQHARENGIEEAAQLMEIQSPHVFCDPDDLAGKIRALAEAVRP